MISALPNTIVIFTSDNGAEVMSWPDGGPTPFHGEKNTSWDGGQTGNDGERYSAHEDWAATLLAAAGVPDIKEKLLTGYQSGDKTFKVHLDGYNLMPYLKGDTQVPPRREFLYWTDDGELAALRYDKWKAMFLEQPAHGFSVWETPFVSLRVPKLFDLHADPVRGGRDGVD